MLQWPTLAKGGGAPGMQGREEGLHLAEIGAVISAEVEPRARLRPPGYSLKKIRLQQTVLVVTLLGPRVGKEHPDFFESNPWGQGEQKLPRFSQDKVTVSQSGMPGLAPAPVDARPSQVHTHTELLGKDRRIAGQEMSVPATDFPDHGTRFGEKYGQHGAQGGAPLGDLFHEFRFQAHGSSWREPPPWAIPKR